MRRIIAFLFLNACIGWWHCIRDCRGWPERRAGNCNRKRRVASKGRCSSSAHRSLCSSFLRECAGWSRSPSGTRRRRLRRRGGRTPRRIRDNRTWEGGRRSWGRRWSPYWTARIVRRGRWGSHRRGRRHRGRSWSFPWLIWIWLLEFCEMSWQNTGWRAPPLSPYMRRLTPKWPEMQILFTSSATPSSSCFTPTH